MLKINSNAWDRKLGFIALLDSQIEYHYNYVSGKIDKLLVNDYLKLFNALTEMIKLRHFEFHTDFETLELKKARVIRLLLLGIQNRIGNRFSIHCLKVDGNENISLPF